MGAFWNHGSILGKLYAPVSWLRMRHDVRRVPFALYVTSRFLQDRYPTQGVAASASGVEIGGCDESVLARRLARLGRGAGIFVLGHVGSLSNRWEGLHTFT